MVDNRCSGTNHCWHARRAPIMMVIKDGHVVQQCCKCRAIRQVHIEHMNDERDTKGGRTYETSIWKKAGPVRQVGSYWGRLTSRLHV